MKTTPLTAVLVALLALVLSAPASAADWRNIRTGHEIPAEGYCDQPYTVVLPDGAWLCTMTTGRGVEGKSGQHIVAIRSTDRGRSWSKPIDIEPADGPEASWAMPLLTPTGRVYVFYTYNADNLRQVLNSSGRPISRVDTLGRYAYKYSDDGGQTWSQRSYLPMRTTAIDRRNIYGGRLHFFWGVGKPIIDRGHVFLGASKVGNFGQGFMESSEGILFRSDNLLTEQDPSKHTWAMLPEGDVGLRSPQGLVCDEHTPIALSDGTLYVMARSTAGSPVEYYSRDRGNTWTAPAFATYSTGRRIRHPRANAHLWKLRDGAFLLWFHNHGGRSYDDRNPAWLSAGHERDGRIRWSEPEILLYDPDPKVRMSYPDLIEQDGRLWITETQKTIARVHEIDPRMINALRRQHEARDVARAGLRLELRQPGPAAMPSLPDLTTGGGFSIDLDLAVPDPLRTQLLLDTRNPMGSGIALTLNDRGAIWLELSDGRTTSNFESDPGLLRPGQVHHVTVTVDGGPKLITFVMDGRLCDGDAQRQFGWGRFDPQLQSPNGADMVQPAMSVRSLRVYDRPLLTSEAVGNWRASQPR